MLGPKPTKWWANFDVRWPFRDIIVVVPKRTTGDPYDEAARILDAPWHQPPFNARTMVADTVTAWSETFLDMSADAGKYAQKPITFGAHKRVTIPNEGDYRVAQRLSSELTSIMFDKPMDVIACGHVAVEAKGKRGTQGYSILRAGFATIGQAQVSTYGGQFDQYIRLKHKTKQEQNVVVSQMMGDSIYAAKVREDGREPPLKEEVVPNTLQGQREWHARRMREAGIDPNDPLTGYIRMALYSEIGVGKTRLALSALRTPIVYVAVDANSEFLRSVFHDLKVSHDAWPIKE